MQVVSMVPGRHGWFRSVVPLTVLIGSHGGIVFQGSFGNVLMYFCALAEVPTDPVFLNLHFLIHGGQVSEKTFSIVSCFSQRKRESGLDCAA